VKPCLDEERLAAFFAPRRSHALVAEVEAHVERCAPCRRLLAQDDRGMSGSAAVPTLTPDGRAEPTGDEEALVPAHVAKQIGAVLKGKWRLESLLGFGGMACVFAARHRNGRRVAIKCMRPELVTESSLVARFLREGYVANKIEHPGAVAILDDDVMDDGTPFLVMELLLGKTLRQRLEGGPLGLQEALRVTADVLDVLAAAHDKGIVHRDVKPDNLFQTEDGSIKVLDFGIARLREHTRSGYETQSGTTIGTVGYMPPEQARGLIDEVDARTDVFAMGATLFALLTGRSVHEAETANDALLLAMTTPVGPTARLLPWLPRSVQALLDRALAFHPDDRYASARAMKSALEVARASLGTTEVLAPSSPIATHDAAPLTELSPAQASETLLARALGRRASTAPSGWGGRWLALIAAAAVLLLGAGVGVSSSRSTRERVAAVDRVAPPVAVPQPSLTAAAEPPSPPVAKAGAAISSTPIPTTAAPTNNAPPKSPSPAPSPRASTGRAPKASPPSPPPPIPTASPSEPPDPLGMRR
jgi:serine/threonine-protein kinase